MVEKEKKRRLGIQMAQRQRLGSGRLTLPRQKWGIVGAMATFPHRPLHARVSFGLHRMWRTQQRSQIARWLCDSEHARCTQFG
jgi:hypothetical protein